MSCCRLKRNQFTIVTCSCYYSNWKEIKETNDESWKFDEIEKGKKFFRKLFHKKMTIVNCCYSCFDKAIIMNPFILSAGAPSGYCIMKRFLNASSSCDEICNSCVMFFVNEFKDEFHFLKPSI